MKSDFPTISKKVVYHVGTMDISLKEKGSYEGSGLSVSTYPKAWGKIAGFTGGTKFALSKPDNRFLDYHSLSVEQNEKIKLWGVEEGYIEICDVYRFCYYDDEMELEMCQQELDRDKLLIEAEGYGIDQVETIDGFKSTPKMDDRCMSYGTTITDMQLLSTMYAEDVLNLDGVWWEDELDVLRYSAPRGVIFNSKIIEWRISTCTMDIRPLGEKERELMKGLYKKKPFKSIPQKLIQDTLGWFCLLEDNKEAKAFAVTDNIDNFLIETLEEDYEAAIKDDVDLEYQVNDFSELENGCAIYSIEAIEEGKGYGTELLEKLKEDNDYIIIIPLESTEDYWHKQGFLKMSNLYWIWEDEDKQEGEEWE